MTTTSAAEPTYEPSDEPFVRQILSAARRYWPEALVGATLLFTGATLLDPVTAAGAFPPQIQSLVGIFGGEALGIAFGLLNRLRQGEKLSDDEIVAEIHRAIPQESLDKLAAQNTDILRQLGRMTVVQQQMEAIQAADYELALALRTAFADQGDHPGINPGHGGADRVQGRRPPPHPRHPPANGRPPPLTSPGARRSWPSCARRWPPAASSP